MEKAMTSAGAEWKIPQATYFNMTGDVVSDPGQLIFPKSNSYSLTTALNSSI